MANEARQKTALDQIRQHIAKSGHHVYVVVAKTTPRFAYTIGVSEWMGSELVLAGGFFYSNDEVPAIINGIAAQGLGTATGASCAGERRLFSARKHTVLPKECLPWRHRERRQGNP